MEAIILAGGLGTRLQSEVSDLPKSMAPVFDKPFLEYQLHYLQVNNVLKFIISVGHLADKIKEYFGNFFQGVPIEYVSESEPLGTGGAVKLAMKATTQPDVLVINGDTIFEIDLVDMMLTHQKLGAEATIALKEMNNYDRYGTVIINDFNQIKEFKEKEFTTTGYINGGIYLINKANWESQNLPDKFSLEEEYFFPKVGSGNFYGYDSDGYFLDIGVPEDYYKAQFELGVFPSMDKTWTLFLDRDGVINKLKPNDYVKKWEEFEWIEGVDNAIRQWTQWVGKIFIVTNQQGVGKGLMTEADLFDIHSKMLQALSQKGGKIDQVYSATQLETENSPMRKPNIGMAQKAKEDFPDIDFDKAIMVGDSDSDMEFGRNAGMPCVKISNENTPKIDQYVSPSLVDLTDSIKKIKKTVI